ncbi:MAG: Ig-like domain-containing protein [Acetobacteraceae bacterium]
MRWLGRHALPRPPVRSSRASSPGSQPVLLFETLEQRVLLNGAVPVGTVLSSDTAPAVVEDADKTSFEVSLSGPGHWQVIQGVGGPELKVTDTTSASAIALKAGGGDGRFLLTGIDVEGPAQSLTGTAINLDGPLTLNGPVGSLFLGDVSAVNGGSLSNNDARFDTERFIAGDASPFHFAIQNGGRLITAPGPGGSGPAGVIGANLGSAGSQVSVTGTDSLWQLNGQLVVGGADSGSLAITAGGAVVAGSIEAGQAAGGSGIISVTGAGSRLSATGDLLLGDGSAADLWILNGAVVTAANATLGVLAGGSGVIDLEGEGSRLDITGDLTIGGAGSAVLVLGAGTELNVTGNLNIGPGGVLTSFGGSIGSPGVNRPTLNVALVNDTGANKTDRITADATTAGKAVAANGVATLRAALGGAADADYVDLTDGLAADGTFTISAAQLAALNGGALPDGEHTLHLMLTDRAGFRQQADLTLTLLTVAPAITSFALAPSSQTGAPGSNSTAYSLVSLTGEASQGSTLTLNGQSVLAGAGGVFQIPNVELASGENTFTLTATNQIGLTSTRTLTVTRTGTVGADVALTWNQMTLDTIAGMALYPTDGSRLLAIVSLAQYDTLAAIEGTPAYMVHATPNGPVNETAALAQTAYEVLVSLFPSRKALYDAALATSLTGIADGAEKTAGLALGSFIADTILAIRASDGSSDFVTIEGGEDPGDWEPTAPMFLQAIDPQWGSVTPFAIASSDALVQEIGPPPALDSAEWAAALNQVESLGSATSSTRTADQSQIAQFWSGGTGTPTPPGLWNTIAQVVSRQQGLSLSGNIRLLAELNAAMADSAIACWDVKYGYDGSIASFQQDATGTWRPIQAIPVANSVNPAATSDPNWTPLLITPAFPEYVSGHSTFSAAASVILGSVFGDATSFSFGVPNLPGVTRSFASFSAAADEAGMSRIYGGIHFMFSNTGGKALGRLIANEVLARFALSADTQAPAIVAQATPPDGKANLTLAGQIVDNLSGVQSATVSIDGGAAQVLVLDAQGNFSIATGFALNGSADGPHVVDISASDAAGNVASFSRTYLLDTKAPALSLTSLADGDILAADSRLIGIANPTGTTLVALHYTIDGGVSTPVTFNATTGVFDQGVALGNLGIGTHSLVLTAQDAAGNTAILARSVNVVALAPFIVTGITPDDGSTDIGTTYRPRISFSRAVNPATLDASSFFATGPDGSVLAATIAPSDDGSYAWMFFADPLPGGAQITLHVIGSRIRAATDGTFLDADLDGVPGGEITHSFSTVRLTSVPGTRLVGRVVDPGVDLTPMTFDDVRRGPDGIIHTPDDVFVNPIAHAKIYILGREDQVVFTDANGLFELDDVPVGDVKLAVDGRTATNPPAGVFWPEMVMDLNVKPGVTNTVMGTMGSDAEQAVNQDIRSVYLPRVPTGALTTISTVAATTVTVDPADAPALTDAQRASLTLTVQPGTALDAQGRPIDTPVQIGVSTVPPELVKDMLPDGILQHSFDITIQAPGVAAFSQPLRITFPNVFDAAPGTQLNILSFDHTTGRLVIVGTATVSADGATAVSDPGQGVLAPGWHGLTPPGSPAKTSPPQPPCDGGALATDTALALVKDALSCAAALKQDIGNILDAFSSIADAVAQIRTLKQVADQARAAHDQLTYEQKAQLLASGCALIQDSINVALDIIATEESELPAIVSCINGGLDVLNAFCSSAISNNCFTLKTVALIECDLINTLSIFSKDINNLAALIDGSHLRGSVAGLCDNVAAFSTFVNNQAGSHNIMASAFEVMAAEDDPAIAMLDAIIASADESTGAIGDLGAKVTALGDAPQPDAKTLEEVAGFFYQAIAGSPANAYYEVTFGNNVLRGNANQDGAISVFLPADTQFELKVFDARYDRYAVYDGTTATTGRDTTIPPLLFLPIAGLPQTGPGGLPDLIEEIIGGSLTKADNLIPGVTDYVAVHQGGGPVHSLANTTGVVASVTLHGDARALDVVGSVAGGMLQTAYVATGTGGLAIVDVTSPLAPVVRSELRLPGFASDVAVDVGLSVAAVASGAAGLTLLDVMDPTDPMVVATLPFADPVTAVTVRDGIAYLVQGTSVASVDLVTHQVRTTLDLSASGEHAPLIAIAFDGSTLFTRGNDGTIRAISVDGDLFTPRGSLVAVLPNQASLGAGGLTIAGNLLYAGASSLGYVTVSVADLDHLAIVGPASTLSIGASAMALNGSGLAVAVGFGGNAGAVYLMDVSDPTDTGRLVTSFPLQSAPVDVALANGIAFVIDGENGLQVVNYRTLDNQGTPPTVSIAVQANDVDAAAAGVQVVEGGLVRIRPTVTDDVQVRDVQVLVNGTVVADRPAYPFDFDTLVPSIASAGATMTLQVRAVDTGGNATLSNIVTLAVVHDTVPPAVARMNIAQGANLYAARSIEIGFTEPLDTARLATSGIVLVNVGPDGNAGTADDVAVPVTFTTRELGRVLTVLPSDALSAGTYRLRIDPSVIADTAGNTAAAAITLGFHILPASNVAAAIGTPAIPQEPSANPGQQIGIAVPFDPLLAHMTFRVIDPGGAQSTVDATPARVDAAASIAYFTVPMEALTGDVTVYGSNAGTTLDVPDGTFPLQIVPVVTGIKVLQGSGDNSIAVVQVTGRGLINGNGTTYRIGGTSIVDVSIVSGPEVTTQNVEALVTVPLSAAAFGPITVTTAGGTSVPFAVNLLGLTGTALSGTPANAALPSANPGQAVTLSGTGISTASSVYLSYTDAAGAAQVDFVHPVAAAIDGTSAMLVIPANANGIAKLSLIGSSATQTVQIVPTLSGYRVAGADSLQLTGSGLVPGASTYNFPGGNYADTGSGDPALAYPNGDGSTVILPEPLHGFGTATVTTAGGTSAPLLLNEVQARDGALRDIAADPATGRLWLADDANPALLHLIDTATGSEIGSLTLASAFQGGLQVAPAAFSLAGTAVPAGSLLLFGPLGAGDSVTAIDAASGAVIATLALTPSYVTTAGVFVPSVSGGEVFILDRTQATTQIVGLNPETGAERVRFDAPFNAGEAGLALDPTHGTIWYGADQSTDLVELTTTGSEVRRVSVAAQGGNLSPGDISGLAVDQAGRLLVASTQGVVYRIDPAVTLSTTAPVLTRIIAAATDGIAADAALAAANAGQVITLQGSNFNAGTEVVFATSDATGTAGRTSVAPLAVSADGTRLQVQVPVTAATGSVQVVNVGARNLAANSDNDGVYRQVTVSFTPSGSTAQFTFGDGGMATFGGGTWGIDNVAVRQNGATVFSDAFDTGTAKSQWSVRTVDGSAAGVLSGFLGQFSNRSVNLNLTGLAAGQAVTLTFDLYILDGWTGANQFNGPAEFLVRGNGQTLFDAQFSNTASQAQTYNTSAALTLQVVPTLTGIPFGGANAADGVELAGSGFMAGGTTITIGGVVLQDQHADQASYVVNATNSDYTFRAPLTIEAPIRVTTAGGSAQIGAFLYPEQPPVTFTGIQSTARAGTPADAAVASANVGQTITLTGAGFTFATLVQFTAADDTGAIGTLTRFGTPNDAGTTLTVTVPSLARTGAVRVLGSTASAQLQVVPVLRSVGGTVASGGTIELEGSGLSASDLMISIDGRSAGTFQVRTVQDTTPSGTIPGQQLVTLTVPSAIGAGVVTVTTDGGSMMLNTGVSAAQTAVSAPADGGDTLAMAMPIVLPAHGGQTVVTATLGDNSGSAGDVDLYKVVLNQSDSLTIGLFADPSLPQNQFLDSHVAVFDAAGRQVANRFLVQAGTAGPVLTFVAPAGGDYYVGVSGSANQSYDPTIANSGAAGNADTGTYQLSLERIGAADTHLTGVVASPGQGIPAIAGAPAANVGQTITLQGHGLSANDQVVFTAIGPAGVIGRPVTPVDAAADGTSLTVAVPADAMTGTVRLERDTAGLLLQVVPTLAGVSAAFGNGYNGSPIGLTGSGFVDGATTIHFGTSTLVDTSRSDGIAVQSDTAPPFAPNSRIAATVPRDAAIGPISVTTPGGTSIVFDESFTGLTAIAASGTPATPALASANPGQTIRVTGSHLSLDSQFVFETVDTQGTRRQVTATPSAVNDAGTQADLIVPTNAATGVVRMIGDTEATSVPLQIVPVVSGISVFFVSGDSVTLSLEGAGFIEGDSDYQFGPTLFFDRSLTAGADVDDFTGANGRASLTLPLGGGIFGPLTVQTDGGRSAPLAFSLTSVTATAASGTPANAALPSANAGQDVTLHGSHLTTATGILLRSTDSSGRPVVTLLRPATAAEDGTSATLMLPTFANGVVTLQALGSAASLTLQVVPTVTGYDTSNGPLTLSGSGFVEGAATYRIANATVTDSAIDNGPDVVGSSVDNDTVSLDNPTHGTGSITVTTAAGTSAPLSLTEANPA